MDLRLRVSLVAALGLWVWLSACSDGEHTKEIYPDGKALSAVVSEHLERSTSHPPAVLMAATDKPKRDADAEIGLKWTFEPKTLRVFRSTAVHLNLEQAPVEPAHNAPGSLVMGVPTRTDAKSPTRSMEVELTRV